MRRNSAGYVRARRIRLALYVAFLTTLILSVYRGMMGLVA